MPAAGQQLTSEAGFTLVELLVALVVMALLSLMSWRGLDGMAQAVAHQQARSDQLQLLHSSLAQWGADLDALAEGAPQVLDWNGLSLRLTRRSANPAEPALQVVAWTRRTEAGQSGWLRWQSEPVQTFQQWQTAWQQAGLWGQGAGGVVLGSALPLLPLTGWQLYFYRAGAWSNALSSADAATALPDGVRLQIDLPGNFALSGRITRDWIRPTLGANKS
jgi:general secretion pathway protein J